MSPSLLAEAVKLSIPERIALVEAIWDTIADEPASIPVPEAHKAELDRRLKDLADDPDAGRPWEEVRARLEQIP
jgi:putative addiction module component (TIGR02574 family)